MIFYIKKSLLFFYTLIIMNPILKKWFYAKLDDMLNSVSIFNEYLIIPRPEFSKVNNIITLSQAKYVVEEIYGCKIQCEKCIVNIPVDFINYVNNKSKIKIEQDAIEYLFKWINSLIVLLTDDKSIDDIKNEKFKVSKREKLLNIIEERKIEIEKLKNNIKKINKEKPTSTEFNKRDELVDGYKLAFLTFGEIPNLTPSEMIVIAKYRNNEPLTNEKLSALSNETLENIKLQYVNNNVNLSDEEFVLLANYRLGLPLTLNDEEIQLEKDLYSTDSDSDSESDNEIDDIKNVKLHEPSGKNIITYKNTNYVVEGGIVVGKLNKIHNVNYTFSNSKKVNSYDKYFVDKLNKKDLKLLKRKGWNLIEDVDIDKKFFKSNNENINDLRDISKGIISQREEARDKIPKVTKLQKKLNALQTKFEAEIQELKNIKDDEDDIVQEYNKFLQARIDMFNTFKLPVKNYGLNTDTENYFISSVVHIIDKLCKWLDIKIITDNEILTAVKFLSPKNLKNNKSFDSDSNIIVILLSMFEVYEYKLNNNILKHLSIIINNFDNLDLNKRLQVFSNEGKFKIIKNELPSFLISDKSKKLLQAPKHLNNINTVQNTQVEHLSKTARFHNFYNDYKANKILPDKPRMNYDLKQPTEVNLPVNEEMKQKEILFKKHPEKNKNIQTISSSEYADMMKNLKQRN